MQAKSYSSSFGKPVNHQGVSWILKLLFYLGMRIGKRIGISFIKSQHLTLPLKSDFIEPLFPTILIAQ